MFQSTSLVNANQKTMYEVSMGILRLIKFDNTEYHKQVFIVNKMTAIIVSDELNKD